jgi:hypothetical protein
MQCVLSVRAPNYQDDQTHTWRIVPGPPVLNGIFRQWPAVWSVQGAGGRVVSVGTAVPRAPSPRANELLGAPSETWKTTVPETRAPIAVAVNATTGRIGFLSQHGLINVNGAITGTTSAGGSQTPIIASLQEWPFPVIDDVGTATTISGTRTRSVPYGVGWRQPPGVPTTETCTWQFAKTAATDAALSSSNAATGTTTQQTTLRPAGSGGAIQTTQPTSTDTLRRDSPLNSGLTSPLNAIAITVTYPNGGETVTIGTPINITWTHLLASGTVFTADVSYDSGTTWVPTQLNSSSGTLMWTVSGTAGARTRVRVRTLDGATADQSNADFTIAASSTSGNTSTSTSNSGSSAPVTPTVRVTSPNGGETWLMGTTRVVGVVPAPTYGTSTGLIRWESTYPSTQSFDINYSGDGGATWQRLGTTAGTSFTPTMWTAPLTEQALISVTPRGGAGDTSDAPFHLRKPLQVTYPNGGETLTTGRTIGITYSSQLSATTGNAAEISYDSGVTWSPLINSQVSGTTSLEWTVSGPATTRARVRVTVSGSAVDESDADFTIAP